MKNLYLILISILFFVNMGVAVSQTKIIGKVLSKDSNFYIHNATVYINKTNYVLTNKKGVFEFKDIKNDSVRIEITHIGFKKFTHTFAINTHKKKIKLPTIYLQKDIVELGEIKVNGQGVLEQVIGDTTQYNVEYLNMNKYATAKDLVESLPGVYRDQDGNLIAKGKEVTIVTVNGKQIFRGKIDENLETLPANIISKVQIYDDYSEIKKFCGFDSNYSRGSAVNLITKYKELKLAMGDYSAGIGNKDRYKFNGNNTFLLGSSNFNIKEFLSNTPHGINSHMHYYPYRYKNYGAKSSFSNIQKRTELYIEARYENKKSNKESFYSKEYTNENICSCSNSNKEQKSQYGTINTTLDFSLNDKNKMYFNNEFSYNKLLQNSTINALQTQNSNTIYSSDYLRNSDKIIKNIYNNIISRHLLNPNLYMQFDLATTLRNNIEESKNEGLVNNENLYETQVLKSHTQLYEFTPTFIYKSTNDELFKIQYNCSYEKNELTNNNSVNTLSYIINSVECISDLEYKRSYLHYELKFRNVKSIHSVINNNFYNFVFRFDSYFYFTPKYYLKISGSRATTTPQLNQVSDIYNSNNPMYYSLGNKDLKQSIKEDVNIRIDKRKKFYNFNYYIGYKRIKNAIVNSSFFIKNNMFNGIQYKNGSIINYYKNTNGYWSAYCDIRTRLFKKILLNFNYNYTQSPNFYENKKNYYRSNTIRYSLSYSNYRNKNFTFSIQNNIDYTNGVNTINKLKPQYASSNTYLTLNFLNVLGAFFTFNYHNYITYSKLYNENTNCRNRLEISIRKPLFKKKFDLVFYINDLFVNNKVNYVVNNQDYVMKTSSKLINRYFLFKLKYKFTNIGTKYNNRFRNKFGRELSY